jgi:tellurite resistance protein
MAGSAYFAAAGQTVTFMACALGGYAILMALVQVRLIPVYRRLSFTPGFWSFAFAYAAAPSDALVWLAIKKPPAATGYAIAIITLITGFTRGSPSARRSSPSAASSSPHPAHHRRSSTGRHDQRYRRDHGIRKRQGGHRCSGDHHTAGIDTRIR